MGKPYESELRNVPLTYSWAMSQDITGLCLAIKSSAHLPLLAVGSGGSLSAAETLVSCHQHNVGGFARAVTPLELIAALPHNGCASVWFFSAGGGNIDVRRAFEHTLLAEPKHVSAIVGRKNSPLSDIVNKYNYADLFELDLPAGTDGFLATNSLLAFSVLVCRAYDDISNGSAPLPDTVESLLAEALHDKMSLSSLEGLSQEVLQKDTIHVLYSSELKPVAVDIESKFIEAGLSSVHLADFRNFAHGRHHWLDKHPGSSALLVLSTPNDHILAEDTIGLIPPAIPRLHIPIRATGSMARISGLILSLFLTGYAGKAKGIDPGKPGVPEYGGKIYNLETASGFSGSVDWAEAAIRRKVGTSPLLIESVRRNSWFEAYHRFNTTISEAKFGAVVMDYDGTVVDDRHRFYPAKSAITEQIVRLLRLGVIVGFATGRGKSIRQDLRKVIPTELWGLITIGYYNGAEISSLSDDVTPDGDSPPCQDLQKALDSLNKNLEISSLANITARKYQLTVEPKHMVPENLMFELAQDELNYSAYVSGNIFRSSHSIDILAQGVSKVSVVDEISNQLAPELNILTIGDRGRWPGNDSRLLKHVYSLSVEEVSPCQNSGWNLCPPGIRGPQGTLYYLSNLQAVLSSDPAVKLVCGEPL